MSRKAQAVRINAYAASASETISGNVVSGVSL